MRRAASLNRELLYCGKFKQAMWELCKNRAISIPNAEKALGFKDGFIESVEKGIHVLTLEEVQKIAEYFHTTMESVLEGGRSECRVELRSCDELSRRQEEDCINAYMRLLNSKGMNYWKTGLLEEEVNEGKRQLEKYEFAFMKHFKAHMDEVEAEERSRKMAKCEDKILVEELLKRGYKVEKDGSRDGEYNSQNKL